MSTSQKTPYTQVYRLMLYGRALHPELFELRGRRCERHGAYEVERWLLPSGHVVRFSAHGHCLTETVLDNADHLPEHGLVHALPCLGEKDYEMPAAEGLGYITTIQTESLTDNLFNATYRELLEMAGDDPTNLCHTWRNDDGAQCLSALDMQKYRDQLHVQSYHLNGSTGFVLRTQSIFEVVD